MQFIKEITISSIVRISKIIVNKLLTYKQCICFFFALSVISLIPGPRNLLTKFSLISFNLNCSAFLDFKLKEHFNGINTYGACLFYVYLLNLNYAINKGHIFLPIYWSTYVTKAISPEQFFAKQFTV